MKKRLLQVVAIGVMVLFMGAVSAESEDGEHHRMHRSHGMMHGGPDIDRIVEHMSRRLELDETQELAIRNIVDAAKPEAEALHQQARSFHETMRDLNPADADYGVRLQDYARQKGELVTRATLLHGRVMADISAALTDEQRVKLSERRDGMRKRFMQHGRYGESAEESTL